MVKRSRPFAALGAADALPFEDGSFTAVSSIGMFMFCPDPAAVLREMHRVGGRLGLWTTAPEGRGTPAAPEPFASRGHFHTDTELVEYALAAGYSDARLAVRDEWSQLLVAQP